MKIIILTIICICQIFAKVELRDPSPPFWGGNPQYQVQVVMTYDDPIMVWNFTYYYDALLKTQRYEHKAPQADQMCLLADPPFGINDSCVVIHAVDRWSYILYPQHNWCCKCENTFHYVNYQWLQQNSTYVGIETLGNYTVQHWTKMGNYLNHYYNTVASLPVRYFQLKNNIPKAWDFDLSTYKKGPVDPIKFAPPCTNLCGGGCPSFRNNLNRQQSI